MKNRLPRISLSVGLVSTFATCTDLEARAPPNTESYSTPSQDRPDHGVPGSVIQYDAGRGIPDARYRFIDAGEVRRDDGGIESILDAGNFRDSGFPRRDAGYILDGGPRDAGVYPPTMPFESDNNCLALYHLDVDNPLQNSCKVVYALIRDHNSQSVDGQFNEARHFDGNSYLYGVGNMTLDLVDALTVEAWIKPDLRNRSFTRGEIGNIFETLYADRYQTGRGDGWQGFSLYVSASGIVFTLGVNNANLSVEVPVTLDTEHFTHITGVYDGHKAKIYINGRLRVEREQVGILTRIPYPDVAFGVGADRNGEAAFIGVIDEVRISNVARY